MPSPAIEALILREQLPIEFKETVERWYTPLLENIVASKGSGTLVIGIQGLQGSGKSTLAQFLVLLAQEQFSLNAVDISLDDFYLTKRERAVLSQTLHPLLVTRGVPGTHDITLAIDTISKLKATTNDSLVHLPQFDKSVDDRRPVCDWKQSKGHVDLVIFEGWCVGCRPQTAAELTDPINQLEAREDSKAIWRNYVNDQLAGDYQKLFKLLDKLVVLQAPSFDTVIEWRSLQEQKLAQSLSRNADFNELELLDHGKLERFISHYERLSRHALSTLPSEADWLLTLDCSHRITGLTQRK